VQRIPVVHDFTYISASTSRIMGDFKMVKLHACWRCVCVPTMKYEMTYKVTYGKVSGSLQKSVDWEDQSQWAAFL
jgi:hypothetical protein